jgi:hypothetical protein
MEKVHSVFEAAKTKYKEEVKTEKVKSMFNGAYSKVMIYESLMVLVQWNCAEAEGELTLVRSVVGSGWVEKVYFSWFP